MNLDLKKILKELSNKRIFLLQSSSILVVISIVYLFFFYEHEYTSTSKVYLSDKSSNELSLGGLSQFGLQIPFSQGSATSQISIMNELVGSFSFLESLLNNQINVSESNQISLYDFLIDDEEIKNINDNYQLKVDAINKLGKKISIVENYQASIVKISVTDKNIYAAHSINKLVILKVNETLANMDNKQAKEKLLFINDRILEVELNLQNAENDLAEFRYENKQISSSITLQLQLDKLTRALSFQTNIMSTLLEQKEVAKIQNIEKTNLFNVLDSPNLPFYASSPRRLFQLILYGILSIITPIFLIISKMFYRNLMNYFNNIFYLDS